jgi:hypothetical protein
VLGEVSDFEAVLREFGCSKLTVSGSGVFSARVVKLALYHTVLLYTEEAISRTATFRSVRGTRRFILPTTVGRMTCGGLVSAPGIIITHGGGQVVKDVVSGPCEVKMILISDDLLSTHLKVMAKSDRHLPKRTSLWKPSPGPLAELTMLYQSAIKLSVSKQQESYGKDSYRGLEQQIIDALIACLQS